MARARFDDPGYTIDNYDNTQFGGYTGSMRKDADGNVSVWGTNQEQNRYRQLAEAAAQRQAYQVNFDAANGNLAQAQQSRSAQLEAAGMLGQAAAGNAPSRAAILGNAAAGQGLQAQLEQSAGARGGLAAAAAQAQMARQAQGAQLQAISQFGGARAGELNDARNAYLQTGTAMRGQDYEAQGLAQKQAEAQAQAENYQRQLNQQAEMTNYQREFGVNQANLDAGIKNRAMDEQKMEIDRRADEERTDRMMKTYASVAQAAAVAASDERAKEDIVPLYNPPGQELRMAPEGRGYFVDEGTPVESMTGGASLSGGSPKKSLAAAVAKAQPKARKKTPDELAAEADRAIAKTEEQTAAIDRQAPAVRDRMGAALEQGLQPYAYAYKPGFDEAERQAPGEQNVGPMAQAMASNPVTGTAVKEGPNGLLYIDQPKALKLSLGAAGYLAARQREQEQRLAALEKRR